MSSAPRCSAGAKVNLCLFLGPLRADGRHELVTLFETVDLADELRITPAADGGDQVVCPGVRGDNLVSAALAELRAAGWQAPPVRVEIEKRIPVAAGMGGGSADAAAMLRYAPALAPVSAETVAEIAAGLGADVPSQLDPGPSLGSGAGEDVEPVRVGGTHAFVVIPQPFGLSTPDVFREADRLGLPRTEAELARLRSELASALEASAGWPGPLPGGLMVNDLQAAAVSLRPSIADALAAATEQEADSALVCGSGPTVIGVFSGTERSDRARLAAQRLQSRFPGATSTEPVLRGLAAPTPNQ